MADWEGIHDRLQAVAERGEQAWAPLLELLVPELVRLARFQPIGRLKSDEDAPNDIATSVIGRLRANEFRAIKKLFSLDRPPKTRAWIRVLLRSAAIDFMRGQPEFQRAGAKNEAGWISLDTLASSDGSTGASSIEAKRREVTQFIDAAAAAADDAVGEHGDEAPAALARAWGVKVIHARRLVKKRDLVPRVLADVLAGFTYPEVGERCGISRREVELVVRYIEEFLHARGFAGQSTS